NECRAAVGAVAQVHVSDAFCDLDRFRHGWRYRVVLVHEGRAVQGTSAPTVVSDIPTETLHLDDCRRRPCVLGAVRIDRRSGWHQEAIAFTAARAACTVTLVLELLAAVARGGAATAVVLDLQAAPGDPRRLKHHRNGTVANQKDVSIGDACRR